MRYTWQRAVLTAVSLGGGALLAACGAPARRATPADLHPSPRPAAEASTEVISGLCIDACSARRGPLLAPHAFVLDGELLRLRGSAAESTLSERRLRALPPDSIAVVSRLTRAEAARAAPGVGGPVFAIETLRYRADRARRDSVPPPRP